MALFTVTFTTKHSVSRFNDKRELIETIDSETPVTMHKLPHSTAMTYSTCDNFVLIRELNTLADEKVSFKKNSNRPSNWHSKSLPDIKVRSAKLKATKGSTALAAAASGDMSGAINA